MTQATLFFHHEPLPDALEDARRELGGKGMSLRRLHELGVRVPRGFTISANVCRYFLEHGRWPENVWPTVVDAVQRIEQLTGKNFTRAEGDDWRLRLAVRSGAGDSMPGLLKTFLNVDEQSLRQAIEDVFRSWTSEGAHQYREACGISHATGTAVNVQEMIACTLSGVLFTKSPDADDVLVVEAVAGSGDALVSGRSTPLRWLIQRECLEIVEGPETLTSPFDDFVDRLAELCRCGLQLEASFGEPLDVEWGLDGEGFVFFQARPIVGDNEGLEVARAGPCAALLTLPPDVKLSPVQLADYRQREQLRLQKLADVGARCWVRHNLSETLAYPTPLTWSLWRAFMSGGGGLGTLYRRLGYRPGRQVKGESFLTLIAGSIYADPDRAAQMFGDGYPLSYDLDELRRDPSLLDQSPRRFDARRLDPFFLWRLPVFGWRAWQAQRRIARQLAKAADHFENEIVPKFLQAVEEERAVDLADQSTDELIALFATRRRLVMDEFGPESLLPGTLGGMAHAELTRQVTRILGPEAGARLAIELVPAGDVVLMRRQMDLLSRVHDEAGRRAFLAEFGHRAVGEMELSVPRWRETPDVMLRFSAKHPTVQQAEGGGVRSAAHGPEGAGDSLSKSLAGNARHAGPFASLLPLPPSALCLDRLSAHQRLEVAFTDAGARRLFPSAVVWLDHCWRLLPYRDRGKHLFLMGYELLREVVEELADRLELGDGIYLLTADEWPDVVAGRDLRPLIERRRIERNAAQSVRIPDFIDAGRLDEIFARSFARPTEVVSQGTPLVGGIGRGVVWKLSANLSPQLHGAAVVLVCEALEPSLAPLLSQVVAVIVARGGGLSHGATLARQFGVPVVRLADATQLFSEGQSVVVDGQTGRVELVREGLA